MKNNQGCQQYRWYTIHSISIFNTTFTENQVRIDGNFIQI